MSNPPGQRSRPDLSFYLGSNERSPVPASYATGKGSFHFSFFAPRELHVLAARIREQDRWRFTTDSDLYRVALKIGLEALADHHGVPSTLQVLDAMLQVQTDDLIREGGLKAVDRLVTSIRETLATVGRARAEALVKGTIEEFSRIPDPSYRAYFLGLVETRVKPLLKPLSASPGGAEVVSLAERRAISLKPSAAVQEDAEVAEKR